MSETTICPYCHQPIKSTTLSTSVSTQIFLYLKTVILPPMGFFWGYRYLQQPDNKSRIVGLAAIIITFIEIIWLIQSSISLINAVTLQMNQLGL
jgi:hypothetical protein